MKISNLGAIAAINSMTNLLDGGSSAGTLKIYTGVQPVDVSVAITTQTELSSNVLSDPAFPSATDAGNGTATASANGLVSATGIAAGTGTWFRSFDSNGVAVIDGTVGLSGDIPTPEMIVDDKVFAINKVVNLNSWVISIAE